MPIYYPIGRKLLTPAEVVERAVTRSLPEMPAKAMGLAPGALPFEPIGLNKPLAIEIRHVYTGASPHGKDMLVTSAIKGMTTYEGAPRAVNLLTKKVARSSNFVGVPAQDKGTFLVFYSPAILDTSASLTVEITFDRFPAEAFERVGDASTAAAKIPLFLPHAGVLVAAGMVVKLLAKIGEALADGVPDFSETCTIDIHRPGSALPEPGFRLLTSRSFPPDELERLSYDNGKLVDADGAPYAGPHAYVVLSLDGRTNDGYKEFSSTAASAALLERFYRQKEGSEFAISALMDGVKILNDWKLREKAIDVKKQLGQPGLSPEQKEELADRFKALSAGILQPDLRPAS